MSQCDLGCLDAVLPPDLSSAVMPELMRMPMRDDEAGFLDLFDPYSMARWYEFVS
jgi:hypothetical protein